MTQKLLITTDFSDAAEVGVRYGAALAQSLGAEATLVHVWSSEAVAAPPATLGWSSAKQRALVEEIRTHLSGRLEEAGSLVPDDVPLSTLLLDDRSVARAITSHAEENGFDLIVISTHGRTGVGHFLLGSVAEKVVRLAAGRVLTVPAR